MKTKPLLCKRLQCRREFKPKHKNQVYCSRDCAPYGNFKDTEEEVKASVGRVKKLKCYYTPR